MLVGRALSILVRYNFDSFFSVLCVLALSRGHVIARLAIAPRCAKPVPSSLVDIGLLFMSSLVERLLSTLLHLYFPVTHLCYHIHRNIVWGTSVISFLSGDGNRRELFLALIGVGYRWSLSCPSPLVRPSSCHFRYTTILILTRSPSFPALPYFSVGLRPSC